MIPGNRKHLVKITKVDNKRLGYLSVGCDCIKTTPWRKFVSPAS